MALNTYLRYLGFKPDVITALQAEGIMAIDELLNITSEDVKLILKSINLQVVRHPTLIFLLHGLAALEPRRQHPLLHLHLLAPLSGLHHRPPRRQPLLPHQSPK